MATTHYSVERIGAVSTTNLSAVTTATNGAAVHTRDFNRMTVFIAVSGNTGAVTVNIEASPDGTNFYSISSKTYTATNTSDVNSFDSHFPYMRTTTTTQSNSTVSTIIAGKS